MVHTTIPQANNWGRLTFADLGVLPGKDGEQTSGTHASDRHPVDPQPRPHYFLEIAVGVGNTPGAWRLTIRESTGALVLIAEDVEPDTSGERLELLTLVRGLEAVEGPADITILDPSPYVEEGVRYGVREWRENSWLWECFGTMVPVKNADLWQRVDRTSQFHRLKCHFSWANSRDQLSDRIEPGSSKHNVSTKNNPDKLKSALQNMARAANAEPVRSNFQTALFKERQKLLPANQPTREQVARSCVKGKSRPGRQTFPSSQPASVEDAPEHSTANFEWWGQLTWPDRWRLHRRNHREASMSPEAAESNFVHVPLQEITSTGPGRSGSTANENGRLGIRRVAQVWQNAWNYFLQKITPEFWRFCKPAQVTHPLTTGCEKATGW